MNNIILHITAGSGPKEWHWIVSKLAEVFRKEATASGLTCQLLEVSQEVSASLLLSVTGKGCEAFAANRTGGII